VVFAGDEETRLVLFVGIGVPGEAPSLLVTEVANPAEMHRDASQPCDPLITRLTGRRGTASRKIGFRVHIDIAESAVEAHADSGEFSGIVLGSVIKNASLCTGFHAGWDTLPTSVRVVNLSAHAHASMTPATRGGRRGRVLFRDFTAGLTSEATHAVP
jgi:hypothetical protein